MNDTSLGCPTCNPVFRQPNELEIPKFTDGLRRTSRDVHKPAGNSGTCHIEIDRSVLQCNLGFYWMSTDFYHTADPMLTAGLLISLWLPESNYYSSDLSFPVQVQQNKSNGCRQENCPAYKSIWLPGSTFGTSIPYTGNTTKHYSIFATLNFQQIHGIDGLMDRFRERNRI